MQPCAVVSSFTLGPSLVAGLAKGSGVMPDKSLLHLWEPPQLLFQCWLLNPHVNKMLIERALCPPGSGYLYTFVIKSDCEAAPSGAFSWLMCGRALNTMDLIDSKTADLTGVNCRHFPLASVSSYWVIYLSFDLLIGDKRLSLHRRHR